MKKVTFVFDRGVSTALGEASELSDLLPIAFEAVGLMVKSSNTLIHEEELERFSAGNLYDFIRPSGSHRVTLRNRFRESSRIQVVFRLYPDVKNLPNYIRHVLGVSIYFYKGKQEVALYSCTACKKFAFSVGGFTP